MCDDWSKFQGAVLKKPVRNFVWSRRSFQPNSAW